MNARILELIKNPEILSFDDLEILESETQMMPYAQSLRAIYLYGIQRFQPENYKENLSKTAAYTTDKKILYQFINAKKINSVDKEISEEIKPVILEELIKDEVVKEKLDEVINLEEIIVEQIVEKEDALENEIVEEQQADETKVLEVEEVSNVELSFNGIDDFLPSVKFEVPKNHLDYLNPKPKPALVKKELQFPLPKNELKVKVEEKIEPKELEISDLENSDEISFENIQSFDIIQERTIEEKQDVAVEKVSEIIIDEINIDEWKPMSFSTNTPDALIGQQKVEIKKEEPVAITVGNQAEVTVDTIVELEKEVVAEDLPKDNLAVINVSFFGNDVQKIEQKVSKKSEVENEEEENQESVESNVGVFINTWQSWLKIDRKQEAEEQEPVLVKDKIIESFIENNPKISQLKEESNYVVKEKKEDISHLMTETLANLYVEQKLYTKGIKSFEILIGKYPEKKEYFENKIEEIKLLRKSF